MTLDEKITVCLNGNTERFPERAIGLLNDAATALKAAREALRRVRPQATGVLVVEDIDAALKLLESTP